MRVLLSTIGSRGDVQPLVALALELKARGDDVRLCVPPDFREWIEGLGLAVTAIGREVRAGAAALPARPSPELMRQLAEETVAAQFAAIAEAARDRDVIVGATALQLAAPSVAEHLRIPYVFVAFCPTVLPSPLHAPIVMALRGDAAPPADADNRDLWEQDALRWNAIWGGLLNTHRTALGLAPISDVRSHVLTDRPWLACDPTLGPWPDDAHPVYQPGAWVVHDDRPLAPELERFLEAGEPPLYFGFGSMRAPRELGEAVVRAARWLGFRAIVARGWADLSVVGDAPDVLFVGEVNQRALFPRVAAAVHHGGAGTTTAAAQAGTAQVVVPQMFDQHYWAKRVDELGIGVAHAPGVPTTESLIEALDRALGEEVAARARSIRDAVRRDGVGVAARRLAEIVAERD